VGAEENGEKGRIAMRKVGKKSWQRRGGGKVGGGKRVRIGKGRGRKCRGELGRGVKRGEEEGESGGEEKKREKKKKNLEKGESDGDRKALEWVTGGNSAKKEVRIGVGGGENGGGGEREGRGIKRGAGRRVGRDGRDVGRAETERAGGRRGKGGGR